MRRIASLPPDEQAAAIRNRQRRTAAKDGRAITRQTVPLAGWRLLITALDARWRARDVRRRRARWRMEQGFTLIKPLLRVADLRCRAREGADAPVRARRVAWAVQAQTAAAMRVRLPSRARAPTGPACGWRRADLRVARLRVPVRGGRTVARVRPCLLRLVRFLASSPRKRRQRGADIRQWLAGRLPPQV